MKGRRGKQNCKAEVKLQYRPHKASGNLAGISGSSYLSGFSQFEQKAWAFTPLPCSGAGWELPWKGLNLKQEVLCTRSWPWTSWQLKDFWLPSPPLEGCGLHNSMSTTLPLRNPFHPFSKSPPLFHFTPFFSFLLLLIIFVCLLKVKAQAEICTMKTLQKGRYKLWADWNCIWVEGATGGPTDLSLFVNCWERL